MSTSGRPPLEGIRVVDFSRVIAGPMCTQILSDMGAEVIKIENPDGGDDTRKGAGPRANGESHFFMTYNRGKKSVALDFTKPEGQAVVMKLLETADVLVQNFRPGVPKKYGTPGRKFCTSTSAEAISLCTTAWPSRLVKSSATLFLPRL